MSVTYKSFDEILAEIKTYLETAGSKLTDWNPGSILRTTCEGFSQGATLVMQIIQSIENRIWVTTSDGIGLDKHGIDYDQARTSGAKATCAECQFVISPQSSTFTVPLGTVVNTNEPIPRYYEATEEGTIEAGETTVVLPIRALEYGEDQNCPAYYIANVQNLAGILQVTNLLPVTGGADEETDEEYRDRLLVYKQSGLARATKSAVEYGAKTVDGVRSAIADKNLLDHWEPYPYLKMKYTGSWTDIADSSYYYGIRKQGTGVATLKAIMSECIIHLWRTTTGGECTLTIDGESQTVDLSADTTTKLTISHTFDSQDWHRITLDTGANVGSIEKIEAKADYLAACFVYIDDGTGQPSWSLVRDVYDELENWVGVSSQYFVKRSEIKTVDVTVTVAVKSRVNRDALTLLIENAITETVNSLAMGEKLYESEITNAVHEASDNVKSVTTNVTVETPLDYEVIRAGTIEVLYE